MAINNSPWLLLGSHEPALLAAVEPILASAGNRVKVVLSADAALEAMTAHDLPSLALLDTALPGMAIDELLTAVRAEFSVTALPIVLISDTAADASMGWLHQGLIQDVIPRVANGAYWQIRVEQELRHSEMRRELSASRETAALEAERDRLTGVYNREALLAMLFRETDRAQRMDTSLCLALFDIDDFGHWNSRLGTEACDELLRQVALRTGRLLRSYDLLGRMGKDEFLVVLPGCSPENAMMLAERLRADIFSRPFRVHTNSIRADSIRSDSIRSDSSRGDSIRLSACFGIAVSRGRSPVVVLREAEQALGTARQTGPEMIQCFGETARACPPVTYVSSISGDELVAW